VGDLKKKKSIDKNALFGGGGEKLFLPLGSTAPDLVIFLHTDFLSLYFTSPTFSQSSSREQTHITNAKSAAKAFSLSRWYKFKGLQEWLEPLGIE